MAEISITWIAWERHRRTVELCNLLGINLFALECNLPRILKYPILLWKTYMVIRSNRPSTVIVQNPSIVLTLFCCVLKKIIRFNLVVDAHNAGLVPEITVLKAVPCIYSYYQKKADVVIVTNEELSRIIAKAGGNPLILPDKIPTPPPSLQKFAKLPNTAHKVVFVCTFGKDEPYRDVFKAAYLLAERDVIFYVTGDYRKAPVKKETLPENIILTGFLCEKAYWGLLKHCDLVIDLTLRENCLVCGAYEAVAVGTPLLLSDKRALRNYFYKGAIFTENDAEHIAKNVLRALEDNKVLAEEVKELKIELDQRWEEIYLKEFINTVLNLPPLSRQKRA